MSALDARTFQGPPKRRRTASSRSHTPVGYRYTPPRQQRFSPANRPGTLLRLSAARHVTPTFLPCCAAQERAVAFPRFAARRLATLALIRICLRGALILTDVGSVLVHPRHGAMTVLGSSHRTIGGIDTKMLVLESKPNKLTVMVPIHRLEEIGVRGVVSGDALNALIGALSEASVDEPSNWSRRFKAYEQKMASGEIVQVGEVVRDLTRRQRNGGISAGERRLLDKARGNLVAELALVPGIDSADAANSYVDDLVTGDTPG